MKWWKKLADNLAVLLSTSYLGLVSAILIVETFSFGIIRFDSSVQHAEINQAHRWHHTWCKCTINNVHTYRKHDDIMIMNKTFYFILNWRNLMQ